MPATPSWSDIQPVLDAALDAPPDGRAAVLDRLCADRPDVRAEVEALLAVEDEAEAALGDSAAAFAAPLLADLADEDEDLAGSTLGPYRLEAVLGRGGMGTVYLGKRDDGVYEQSVAVKVVRRGLDTEDVVRRFRQERQVLARLQHPAIARLYDGGVTQDGRPYFVMEHVDGVSLSDWSEAQHADVAARVGIVLQVADAVADAHRQLVIHRDLKPSNVLVTPDGRAKLLDFGIARVLDDEGDALTTRSGPRPMTLAYAAPEQVRGGRPSTATDVYGLGALLYAVLTGRPPFEADDRTALEQAVLGTPPVAPSTVASDGVRDRLRGDLDAVVRKALRKDPEARYATADAFAEDLHRHLNGLPVRARDGDRGYRVRAFVRRHRLGVAVGAVIALLLIALTATAVIFATTTARQNRAILAERDKAAAVADFLTLLFEGNDPDARDGRTLTALDLLNDGAATLDAAALDPVTEAQLRHVLGRVYLSVDEYGRADTLLHAALAARQRLFPEAHPDLIESLESVAAYAHDDGEYARAESLYTEALRLHRQLPDGEVATEIGLVSELGLTLIRQGRYAEADSLLQDGQARFAAELPGLPGPHSDLLNNRAFVLKRMGRYAEAEPLYREALRLTRQEKGDLHTEVASVVGNLGILLQDLGRYDEAEPFLREAQAINSTLFGPESYDVGIALNNLGMLYRDAGRYAEAEALIRQVLTIDRNLFGPDHPDVGLDLNNLGIIQLAGGDARTAEATLRDALAVRGRTLGDDHPQTAQTRYNIARTLEAQNRLGEAEALHRRALADRRAALGDSNTTVAQSLNGLGRVLVMQGHPGEAEPLLREALALRQDGLGAEHWMVGETESLLGRCAALARRYEEAQTRLVRAEALLERAPPLAAWVQDETAQWLAEVRAQR